MVRPRPARAASSGADLGGREPPASRHRCPRLPAPAQTTSACRGELVQQRGGVAGHPPGQHERLKRRRGNGRALPAARSPQAPRRPSARREPARADCRARRGEKPAEARRAAPALPPCAGRARQAGRRSMRSTPAVAPLGGRGPRRGNSPSANPPVGREGRRSAIPDHGGAEPVPLREHRDRERPVPFRAHRDTRSPKRVGQ